MAKPTAKQLFQKYVDTATDFAESVKRNIVKDGIIDDKTVNYLNDFMIATNALANLEDHEIESEDEENDENEFDPKLN